MKFIDGLFLLNDSSSGRPVEMIPLIVMGALFGGFILGLILYVCCAEEELPDVNEVDDAAIVLRLLSQVPQKRS